jgi:hypothetical protein
LKKTEPEQVIYFPPDEGYPRGTKAQEILWCIARGIPKRDARRLVGFSGGYWAIVIKDYRKKDPVKTLQALRSLGWPIDPLDSQPQTYGNL